MEIASAWEIVERVLHDELPLVAATLGPPASPADLDRLAAEVGRELPTDLVASLLIHDGQQEHALHDDLTLLGVDAMIADIAFRADVWGEDVGSDDYAWMTPEKVRTIPNCRGWLRFAVSQAQGYAVDLDPLPAGEVGQVIWLPVDGPTPEPEFASYGAWLTHLAEALEAGRYTVDPDIGLWLSRG